jgi:hypothetical protein
MTTIVSGSQITFNDNTTQNTSAYGGGFAFRNRIINGDMRIDQRNAGASYSVTAGVFGYVSLDRYRVNNSTDGAFTLQQSTTAPTGFSNSLIATVTTTDTSIAAGQFAILQQNIEGFNVADLGFGTAGASTITLSFWVRSSITGTFTGALLNSATNRSYPFSYTINSANTFELKTITVVGDTTGTWLTNNGIGLTVIFALACGSTFTGTAGSWAGATYLGATGQTNLLGTNGATFYITGVQLEKGSTATSFDYRPYGQELALCQRYYIKYGTYSSNSIVAQGSALGTTTAYVSLTFPVSMRTTPTFNSNTLTIGDGVNAATTVTGAVISSLTSDKYGAIDITVASGLTQYRPYTLRATATTGYTEWSAEL